MKLRKRR